MPRTAFYPDLKIKIEHRGNCALKEQQLIFSSLSMNLTYFCQQMTRNTIHWLVCLTDFVTEEQTTRGLGKYFHCNYLRGRHSNLWVRVHWQVKCHPHTTQRIIKYSPQKQTWCAFSLWSIISKINNFLLQK